MDGLASLNVCAALQFRKWYIPFEHPCFCLGVFSTFSVRNGGGSWHLVFHARSESFCKAVIFDLQFCESVLSSNPNAFNIFQNIFFFLNCFCALANITMFALYLHYLIKKKFLLIVTYNYKLYKQKC